MGLCVARQLRLRKPSASILLVEKEKTVAEHASGRNSGVLHSGFYYTADSLKAKFTVSGNRALKDYCHQKGLSINNCGKLVIASNEEELGQLFELEKRGKKNGSNVHIITAKEAETLEPNAKTCAHALYSPDTATVDSKEVCNALFMDLKQQEIQFSFESKYLGQTDNTIVTSRGSFRATCIINCAGLYADKIAHDFGFGKNYTIIPFKGLYLKYTKNKSDICTNIYPVPNLKNPFLGVHFTKTVDGGIKIGPTAIPAFWRENYTLFSRFSLEECLNIMFNEARLLITNSFQFRSLALEELRKYSRDYFIKLAAKLVHQIDPAGFGEFTKPGIRAQLLDRRTLNLVQDFIVEGDKKSVHILNAVSPGFTCSFPFADYIVENYVLA